MSRTKRGTLLWTDDARKSSSPATEAPRQFSTIGSSTTAMISRQCEARPTEIAREKSAFRSTPSGRFRDRE